MIKTLMGSIRDYMKVTIATPLLVLGEVICQMMIPFITADMIDAIKDGTVTCIGTDHAPHTAEEKEKGAAGMVGLETAFGVCYTKLCREQRLPLEMRSFLMSAGPAAVLGLADRKGMLDPGYDADIVLVDLDHMYEVHADELHSKSKNCPYDGALLYGKVVTTIKGGKVTFQIEE